MDFPKPKITLSVTEPTSLGEAKATLESLKVAFLSIVDLIPAISAASVAAFKESVVSGLPEKAIKKHLMPLIHKHIVVHRGSLSVVPEDIIKRGCKIIKSDNDIAVVYHGKEEENTEDELELVIPREFKIKAEALKAIDVLVLEAYDKIIYLHGTIYTTHGERSRVTFQKVHKK